MATAVTKKIYSHRVLTTDATNNADTPQGGIHVSLTPVMSREL